jgi:hypothetical protein
MWEPHARSEEAVFQAASRQALSPTCLKDVTRPNATNSSGRNILSRQLDREVSRKTIGAQPHQSRRTQARVLARFNVPIRRLYTAADLPEVGRGKYLGYPGEAPYTRGVHATGTWQALDHAVCSRASPRPRKPTSAKYLLEHGGGGLSVAFRSAHADGIRL